MRRALLAVLTALLAAAGLVVAPAAFADDPPPSVPVAEPEAPQVTAPTLAEIAAYLDALHADELALAAYLEALEFDRLLDRWGPIHACETGHTYRWGLATGNGYYGGLQFSAGTWAKAGGLRYAARADLARPLDQMRVADSWLARTSWSQWPHCSRTAGYR